MNRRYNSLMSTEFIAVFVGAVILISIFSHFARKRGERLVAERIEAFRQQASLRSIRVELEPHHLVYSGTRDGIRWSFRVTRPYYTPRARDMPDRPSRWETADVRLESGVVQVWPSFGRAEAEKIEGPQVPEFVRDLFFRPITSALGADTGDAKEISTVQVVHSHDQNLEEAFFFRASSPALAERFLSPGVRSILTEASEWLGTKTSWTNPNHLVLMILWKHGLQIVISGTSHDLDLIEKLSKLGAGIARDQLSQTGSV